MDCQDFLQGFSDYYDGSCDPGPFEAHVGRCERCRRYERVIREGVNLVRDAPPLDLSPEFRARLHHRIFHVRDEVTSGSGSGATTATILAIALALAVAAWSPSLWQSEILVELPPIVVSEAPPRAQSTALGTRPVLGPLPDFSVGEANLWSNSHSLLYQYSPLSDRQRRGGLVRTGLQ